MGWFGPMWCCEPTSPPTPKTSPVPHSEFFSWAREYVLQLHPPLPSHSINYYPRHTSRLTHQQSVIYEQSVWNVKLALPVIKQDFSTGRDHTVSRDQILLTAPPPPPPPRLLPTPTEDWFSLYPSLPRPHLAPFLESCAFWIRDF